MKVEKFDVIVVGAGPAGTTAAYVMAKAGLDVALLERGDYPGAKNMYGGVIYRWPIELVVPDFAEKAPVERRVTEHRLMILSKRSGLTLSFKDLSFAQPPYNAFTTLRAKFDCWYAGLAEQAGALLATSVNVTDLIWDGKKVVGVRAGSGPENELYSDVVIAADGANSRLAVKSGLRQPLSSKEVALGVKEILELRPETIRSRFNLEKGEGAAVQVIGATHGMMGGGFIYTNRKSLSIGIVALLEHLIRSKMKPYEILDEFKCHPLIAPLIKGGEPREYSAHLVPEAGYYGVPKLYLDGLLLVGDAASLTSSVYQEGVNMAVESGLYAGRTVIKAKERGDYSSKTLSEYERTLRSSYVMRELYQLRDLPEIFGSNPRLFSLYPEMINYALRELLTMDGELRGAKRKKVMKMIRKRVGLSNLLRDLIKARKLLP
ncbi:MAG: FAD-dependent oxidoreductase [archaeon]|nr:FAD-dependent oxidoreductase [archaeon]MCP8306079.1 FAD-dependent oxidoreductase [archaeon]